MSIRGTTRGRWAAVALLVAGAVLIAGLQLLGRGGSAVDPADLDAIRAAVPELLGRACLLGTIPLEASMDATARDQLVDAALASLHDDVRAVYADEPAGQLEPGLRQSLESMHAGAGDAVSRLDCTFEARQFQQITVRNRDADLQVSGAFHQVAGAPASTVLDYDERQYEVTLQRAGDGWKLLEFHERQPDDDAS